jgi:hypothetical protein
VSGLQIQFFLYMLQVVLDMLVLTCGCRVEEANIIFIFAKIKDGVY